MQNHEISKREVPGAILLPFGQQDCYAFSHHPPPTDPMTLLYLNSDQMGSGDEALGRKLMQLFLAKLSASATPIDLVGCVNSGVRLTTEGSEVIEYLEALKARGARIATCGTCLEHFGLAAKLLIGEVGTMEQSVQAMAMADKVIRP
jgi:selenium metabolism protein YedF